MKKFGLFLLAVMALSAASCSSSNKEAKESQAPEQVEIVEQTLPLEGYWRLIDYIGTDGSINEVPQDVVSIIQFHPENHSFGLSTDCNGMGGEYTTNGDSITFGDICWTEMACSSMIIEESMKELLPRVDSYAISPDSILRLRSDMRIMATFVRTSKEEIKADKEQ